jgi:hypothetical protein
MCEISLNKFEYESLDDNSSAFRLLILSPGTGNSPLDCTLIEDSREVFTFSYEALSYTWGDSSTLQHIRLNNGLFFIKPNLYVALQHLRLADTERILWVDAICINQSCPLEKTQQVSMMRNIYQAAKRVLVWLGEGSEKTFRALSWVGSYSKADEKDLKHLKKATRAIMDACPERSTDIGGPLSIPNKGNNVCHIAWKDNVLVLFQSTIYDGYQTVDEIDVGLKRCLQVLELLEYHSAINLIRY